MDPPYYMHLLLIFNGQIHAVFSFYLPALDMYLNKQGIESSFFSEIYKQRYNFLVIMTEPKMLTKWKGGE